MATVERTCWCGKKFIARSADVKRGWAKACSKAHAAHAREKKLDRFGFQRGAPIALVAYGRYNLTALIQSGLGFVVVGHNT